MKSGRRFFLSFRLACFFILPVSVMGQSTASDSAIRADAIDNAVTNFRNFIGTASPFYSGPRYTEYYAQMKEGHPFFLGTMPRRGEVMFDNILYYNLYLKYDLLMNKLILSDSTHLVNTTLNIEKVDYFIIDGHVMVKLFKTKTNGLPETDFYEIVYEGKGIALFRKETRRISEDSEHKRYIWGDVSFFLKKGDVYHSINTQGKALNAMDDKRAQVRSYIRSNELSFRDNLEVAVKKSVMYYDSLLK
jgi:hypothetical protein